MGVICKARDKHVDRCVAIKVLPPARVAEPGRKRCFVQEAKAVSALNHPNVDFIAMEFIDSKPLDEVIRRKRRTVSTVI